MPPILRERHFCIKCNVDQPLRSKHCNDCQACIATFDHHCEWTGNCVGEKNRPLFFLYLSVQVAELALFTFRPASIILAHGVWASVQSRPLLCVAVLVYGTFTIAVGSLYYYHVYFMIVNITTCEHWSNQGEYLSWDNITYLDGYSRKMPSPFAKSCRHNLVAYFGSPRNAFHDWVHLRPPPKN